MAPDPVAPEPLFSDPVPSEPSSKPVLSKQRSTITQPQDYDIPRGFVLRPTEVDCMIQPQDIPEEVHDYLSDQEEFKGEREFVPANLNEPRQGRRSKSFSGLRGLRGPSAVYSGATYTPEESKQYPR